MLQHFKFSTRITAIFSLIALLSLIVVSIASLTIARSTLINRTQAFIQSAMVNQHRTLTLTLSSGEKTARAIADEVQLTLNYNRYLEDIAYKNQYLSSIEGAVQLAAQINSSRSAFVMILNDDNTYSSIWYRDNNRDSIPEKQTPDALPNRIQLQSIQSKLTPSNLSYWESNVSSAGFITVYVSIYKENRLVAITGSDIAADQLMRELENSNYLETGSMWISDANGESIVTAKQLISNPETQTVLKTFEANGNNIFYESRSYLWAFKPLYNGWNLISKVTIKDVLQGLDYITWIILATFMIAMVLTVIATLYLAKRMAEPYSYLSEKIAAIGAGDYSITLDKKYLDRSDEAGVLSRAIAKTQSQLLENFNAINAAKDNLEYAVQMRTSELLEANRQLESILIDMRETQNQLALSEKMASLSKVLISLSHNMNTPLGNAVTLVTYYEEKQVEILEALRTRTLGQQALEVHLEEGLSVSKHIYDNIQSGRAYIEKISDISRLRQANQPELIQLVNLIESQFLLAVANSIKDEPQLNLTFDTGLTIFASPQLLAEIIYELIDNAISHAQVAEKSLMIEIGADLDELTGKLTLTIADNGRGLTNNEIKDIFTPLVTSQLNQRAGLGLSRIYRIVREDFKGNITVQSIQPNGTLFHLELYCQRNADATKQKA